MARLLESVDENVSRIAEEVARQLTRRQALITGVKGLTALVAAVTAGRFVAVTDAFAVTCTCNWLPLGSGTDCYGHGYGTCPYGGGCPSGCSPCTGQTCCAGYGGCYSWQCCCIYSGGQWVSCNSLGTCGLGYRLCTDCTCPNCAHTCTCRSGIICGNCCTPGDVQAEMARLGIAQ